MEITDLLVFTQKNKASDLHISTGNPPILRIHGEMMPYKAPGMTSDDVKRMLYSIMTEQQRSDYERDLEIDFAISFGEDMRFRVNAFNTMNGAAAVLRISPNRILSLEELAAPEVLKKLCHLHKGMVLVTGPTGSGKTVSLYTCLNILNQPGVNIATAEDPSEINLPGVNQVNVNEKAGLTFSVALKSFLRQDPDIIMVGEIRDLETADISIKAAQTGHMVMSTLHTNDAPSTITRLRNMGVAPFNIASSVVLVTAQRLARRLCAKCKVTLDLPQQALLDAGYKESDLDGSWKPYRAVGCSSCNNGYKGRVGIYQVMPVTDEIQRIILRDGSSMDIAEQAEREGVRSLRASGLHKVKLGLTSIEEVMAVTNE